MKFSIEYLAGIVDGEGCIFVQKDARRAAGYMLWVRINMCHRPFIQMLADELDASVIVHRKDLKNPKHRAAYEVSLHGKRAAKFLQEVFPHLIIKQEEARIALALQDNITRYHHSIATMSPDEMQKIIQFRENCRLQLKAAKRQSFIGVADGMVANSVDIQSPDLFDREGQYRTKQELTAPGARNEQVPPSKEKICSGLHGNMQSSAETTEPYQLKLVK